MVRELAKRYKGAQLVAKVKVLAGVDDDTAKQMIEFELGDPRLAADTVDDDSDAALDAEAS